MAYATMLGTTSMAKPPQPIPSDDPFPEDAAYESRAAPIDTEIARRVLAEHPEAEDYIYIAGEPPASEAAEVYLAYQTALMWPRSGGIEQIVRADFVAHGGISTVSLQGDPPEGMSDRDALARFSTALDATVEPLGIVGRWLSEPEVREMVGEGADVSQLVGAAFTIEHGYADGHTFDVTVSDVIRIENGQVAERWAVKSRNEYPREDDEDPATDWPAVMPDLEPTVEVHADGDRRLAIDRSGADEVALAGAVAALAPTHRVPASWTSLALRGLAEEFEDLEIDEGEETLARREYYADAAEPTARRYFAKVNYLEQGREDRRLGLQEMRIAIEAQRAIREDDVQELARREGFVLGVRLVAPLAVARDETGVETIVYPWVQAEDVEEGTEDHDVLRERVIIPLWRKLRDYGIAPIDLTAEQLMIHTDEQGNRQLIIIDTEGYVRLRR